MVTERPEIPLVVFTDLDGTLLDHKTYDFSPARLAIEALKTRGIPLVLASSKTRAEIAPLQDALGIRHPAIIENGGGAFIPEGYFPDMRSDQEIPGAAPRDGILEAIAALPAALREPFHCFSDWSVEEVARETGLDRESAARARQREWSEPGLWTGDAAGLEDFGAALEARGLLLQRGGRLLHVMGRTDKALVMARLLTLYETAWGQQPVSAALGDAPNDAAMLDAADYGFIIPNPEGAPIQPLKGEAEGRVVRAAAAGPSGWNRSVLGLLEAMEEPRA